MKSFVEILQEKKLTFTVYDNGGDTADRYTVISSDDLKNPSGGLVDMLGLSDNPSSPQGVSMFSQGKAGNHLGKKIKFSSLEKHIQKHIQSRYSD